MHLLYRWSIIWYVGYIYIKKIQLATFGISGVTDLVHCKCTTDFEPCYKIKTNIKPKILVFIEKCTHRVLMRRRKRENRPVPGIWTGEEQTMAKSFRIGGDRNSKCEYTGATRSKKRCEPIQGRWRTERLYRRSLRA